MRREPVSRRHHRAASAFAIIWRDKRVRRHGAAKSGFHWHRPRSDDDQELNSGTRQCVSRDHSVIPECALVRVFCAVGLLRSAPVALSFVVCARTERRILFLGFSARTRERSAGVSILAASRTLVATVSDSAERLSAKSRVAFVSVPAACPRLRATEFRRFRFTSCLFVLFLVAIGFLLLIVFGPHICA
jgi:hypothetical protein